MDHKHGHSMDEMKDKERDSSTERHVRKGWDEAFRTMTANGDDRLPDWDQARLTEWENEGWVWDSPLTTYVEQAE